MSEQIADALEHVLADVRHAAPDAERPAALLEALAEAYRSPADRTRLLRAVLRLA